MADGKIIGTVTIVVEVVEREDGGTFESPPEQWWAFESARTESHTLTQEQLARLGYEINFGDSMVDFTMPQDIQDEAKLAYEESELC